MRCHLLAAAMIFPLTALPAQAAAPPPDLAARISLADVKEHLSAFQAIANRSGGNRAAGTAGYDSSANYITERLRRAGYQVTSQQFTYSYFREKATPRLRSGTSTFLASTVEFSPAGRAQGRAVQVGGHGCLAEDYARLKRGSIALVARGTCTFGVKARQAEVAGAAAVIIVNNEAGRLPDLTLGGPGVTSVPVVVVSPTTGRQLADRQVTVRVRAKTGVRLTTNVIAETPGGRADRVIMAGAHLDSVEEGPGINDNASGSAALLEIAEQLATTRPVNKVRFAWWGAEELGLLGSRHYVSHLPLAERRNIAVYLNFDMIASKNHIYGIYDGDDSDRTGAGPGPAGSEVIEKDFEAFYAERGLPYMGVDFSGRSDYGPFMQVGIPSGGLFTGAEGVKTAAQARLFGGTAGQPYDPCYHKACDTMTNINETVLKVNTDAIAHVIGRYAQRLPDRLRNT